MSTKEQLQNAEDVRSAAIACIFNLVNLANALQRVGMDEDCKQVLETACDICGHAHDAYSFASNLPWPNPSPDTVPTAVSN